MRSFQILSIFSTKQSQVIFKNSEIIFPRISHTAISHSNVNKFEKCFSNWQIHNWKAWDKKFSNIFVLFFLASLIYEIDEKKCWREISKHSDEVLRDVVGTLYLFQLSMVCEHTLIMFFSLILHFENCCFFIFSCWWSLLNNEIFLNFGYK